jgi:hypothetical protein
MLEQEEEIRWKTLGELREKRERKKENDSEKGRKRERIGESRERI